ncbi:MAG: T9SS type A sorting domain-containing protein, partial [Chlorobi bacterium]|nr:T9SS type A sorting domain-containing protein [Chlorobiota bacterium]
GLFINRPGEDNVGLFGCIYEGGNVCDVFIQNANVKGGISVGLFAGLIRTKYADILIENCHSEGTVEGAARIGGFCGETYAFLGEILIKKCSSIGNVSGKNSVGGFSGKNEGNGDFVYIRSCSSNCIVLGVDPGHKNIGGFSGHDQVTYNQVGFGEIVVQQCVSTGSVKGDDRAGGFIGSCLGSYYINCASLCSVEGIGHIGGFVGKILKINVPFPSLLMKCYSVGSVKGSFNVGGFCGIMVADEKIDIKYSYYDIETNSIDSSDGGTGKTTAQMKTRSTFETWDFDEIWGIDPEINNGYPFLKCLPTVSVEEFVSTHAKKLEIIPNPAQDQIQVSIDKEFAAISLVKISDLSGRLVLTSKTDRINISELNSGIYIVSVEINGEIYSTKLIVKK